MPNVTNSLSPLLWGGQAQPGSSPSLQPIGGFQAEVLIAVRELGKKAYGVQIRKYLSDKIFREIHQPQVYAALVKLENIGVLNSEIDSLSSAGRRGRPRRIYSLTAPGLRMLDRRELYLPTPVLHAGDQYGLPTTGAPPEKVGTKGGLRGNLVPQ